MLYKVIVSLVITFSLLGFNPQRLSETELQITPITLEQYVQSIFGSKTKIALAVFKHESNLKLDSINYNCRYNGKSTFCKKGDIYKAWSVDCGIAQINIKGNICPKDFL